MVRPAINQALAEAQLCTMKLFREYIRNKPVNNKDELIEAMGHFENEIVTQSRTSFRKKKEPSEFNMFIREKIIEFKKLHPDYHGHTLMRMAIASWKAVAREPKNNVLII